MNAQDLVSYHIGWVGVLAGMVLAGFDALINVNPLAQRYYAAYRPIMRQSANAGLGVSLDIVFGFIMAILFMALTPALPADPVSRGLTFGLIAWFFRVAMGAASHAVMFEIPIEAPLYTLATGLAEMLILGLIYGALLNPR
jgi:hypothetical protein